MALSINQMMFATVVSIGLLSVIGYGLMEYGRAKRQFDKEIAEEIGASTRMIRVAGDVQRLQNQGDYEGAIALQERAMEQERRRQETSPLLKRMQARRDAGDGEGPGEPAEHRMDGAFYPEDFAQPEEQASLPSALAVAVAGGGGILVFGLVGFVAFQVLGSASEQASTTEEGAAGGDALVDAGDPPADGDFGDESP